MKKYKKFLRVLFVLAILGVVVVYTFSVVTAGQPEAKLGAREHNTEAKRTDKTGRIRLLSLNLAHGRKDGLQQILLSRKEIEKNLVDIAEVLQREKPDVVALQEADGPSFWSGSFDHVAYLAEQSRFAWSLRAANLDGWGLSYGTGLLTNLKPTDSFGVTFSSSAPTPSKGFLVTALSLPGEPAVEIDVVSLHLDFSRQSVRTRQVSELVTYLRKRGRPLILVGDFNAEWDDTGSSVRSTAKQLGLSAYKPNSKNFKTFPTLDSRLDWVLVSEEFNFVNYMVLSDVISDHQAVLVELELVAE